MYVWEAKDQACLVEGKKIGLGISNTLFDWIGVLFVDWIEVLFVGNQVGLVLDAGIEEELRFRHLQVADAARASLGLPVVEYVVTDTPLEVLKFILAG